MKSFNTSPKPYSPPTRHMQLVHKQMNTSTPRLQPQKNAIYMHIPTCDTSLGLLCYLRPKLETLWNWSCYTISLHM